MKKPNILIFMSDQQRGDTILSGHPAITPNVSKIAKEGITFAQTYTTTAHCSPSRASFFTGLYPTRHGVKNNVVNSRALSRGFNENVVLWSDYLLEEGYSLGWSGKWHISVVERPKDRGWEELYLTGYKEAKLEEEWENYKNNTISIHTKRGEGEIKRVGYPALKLYGGRDKEKSSDYKIIKKAIEFIDTHSEDDKPWCLYVGVNGPHDPYNVPEQYLSLYNYKDVKFPVSFNDSMKDKPVIYQRLRKQLWNQLSKREAKEVIRHYYAYCTFIDDLFGDILNALQQRNILDNTIIIYLSDHGDYMGEHGLFFKGVPAFQGAYRIPLVISWRDGIKNPGRIINKFVSITDLAPTILELIGIKHKNNFSGESLTPFIFNENIINWRDALFFQLDGVELYYTQRIIMTKQYKYVFNGFDNDEFYNLTRDPYEIKNVIKSKKYDGIKKSLIKRMWKFMYQEKDTLVSDYSTVALFPYGPGIIFS